MTKYPAYICNTCTFGSKKDNCSKCGKWSPNTKIPAYLCSDCGFWNKVNNCVKCGKWCPVIEPKHFYAMVVVLEAKHKIALNVENGVLDNLFLEIYSSYKLI